jgi:hypothetical protein
MLVTNQNYTKMHGPKNIKFREKVIEHEMCFDFLYNFCLKHEELSEM